MIIHLFEILQASPLIRVRLGIITDEQIICAYEIMHNNMIITRKKLK